MSARRPPLRRLQSCPITQNGTAIYVYSGYGTYEAKRELSTLLKEYLPEYTREMMIAAEEKCGYYGSSAADYSIVSFVGGERVTDITVSGGVSSIEPFAFVGALSLSSVNIGDGVIEIGRSAFEGCTSLKTVTVGKDVLSIGVGAFKDCSALESVTFASTDGWQYDVTDPKVNAANLKEIYVTVRWYVSGE